MEENLELLDTVTSVEFDTAMSELIALEEAQLEALGHMYSTQLLCIGVLAAVCVCALLYNVIHKFL